MTASCRRRSRRSTTPGRRTCRSSSRSTRSTSPTPSPSACAAELLQHEVQVESLGGETLEVEVSATKRTNLDKLLEAIALQAEVARPQGQSRPPGRRHGHRGAARQGPRPGRHRAGAARHAARRRHRRRRLAMGPRPRAASTTRAQTRHEAGPSMPVEVLGFSGAPEAGDRVAVVENEARAREITEYRERQKREQAAARGGIGARLARRHDEPAEDGRAQGVPAGHQGRRAGLGRGDHRGARKARHGRSAGARHARRRRRHHRIRRDAGRSLRAPR